LWFKKKKDKDFAVEEEKGILSIHWGPGDFDALVIPRPVFESSQKAGSAGVGSNGVNVGASVSKETEGQSVVVVTHSGVTQPFETWKSQIEQGLQASGIRTNVVAVYDAQKAIGQAGVSASANSVPYARDVQWTCKECGTVIPPNHPHVH
jgi:hypothetical protein